MLVFGYPLRLMWSPRYDEREATRMVFNISLETKGTIWSVLWQHYRNGYVFDTHTDGVRSNKVISVLLNKPAKGGEFYVDGPNKSYFGKRISVFDGGKHQHGVTKIENGSRTVLMFQKGVW
jgi:hypothetical protein